MPKAVRCSRRVSISHDGGATFVEPWLEHQRRDEGTVERMPFTSPKDEYSVKVSTRIRGSAPRSAVVCTLVGGLWSWMVPVGMLPVATHAAPEDPGGHTSAGWSKPGESPVLGGALGTCFDIAVLRESSRYRMWFSWRDKKSIALVESEDGLSWSEPLIVLGPSVTSDWEDDVNRPVVLKTGDTYAMWYTGQSRGRSRIGYATSTDGRVWTRHGNKPVLSPEQPWEKVAVMCPHVLYDDAAGRYRMWYSAGEQFEPDAIGYATSVDGVAWTRHDRNPVFSPAPHDAWDKDRVTGCQVIKQDDWHVMFYIGFRDRHHAQIGLARSRDGITDWERHPANPIIRPSPDRWDADAVYKPFAILEDGKWLLWYNGRKGSREQIGAAVHEGVDLGFPNPASGR